MIGKVENSQKKPKLSNSILPSTTCSKHCKDSNSCTASSTSCIPTACSSLYSKSAITHENPDKEFLVLKSYDDIKLEPNTQKKVSLSAALKIPDAKQVTDEFDADDESFLFDPALDYTLNKDGSVTCKICKECVPSRTHWYRHKYKVI